MEKDSPLDLPDHVAKNFGTFTSDHIFRTCCCQYDGHPLYKSTDQRSEGKIHVGRDASGNNRCHSLKYRHITPLNPNTWTPQNSILTPVT